MVCAAPLYSTIKLQVSPVGIAGLPVLAVCKLPVPLVDVGLPLSKFVPMLTMRPALIVNIPLVVKASAVLSPLPLAVIPAV